MMVAKAPAHETVASRMDDLLSRFAKISDTPALDAQVLLASTLARPRAWVLAHPEARLSAARSARLDDLVARLEAGEPLPYVLGHCEFYNLDFDLTPDVLIPRPETELLVEAALGWLQRHPDKRRAADVGTGSGCIAVALAANVPDLVVLATDISCAAVDGARRNVKKHRLGKRVECFCSDLMPKDDRSFDLVAANLPYIPTRTLRGLRVYGREPDLALNGGADGLDLIRRLLKEVPDRLTPGGTLLIEIEASQGAQVLSLAFDAFSEAGIHLHQDLSGRDRLLEVSV